MGYLHRAWCAVVPLRVLKRGMFMRKVLNTFKQFGREESGAAMVEYSILIGLIAVASITTVIAIGGWVSGRFTSLCAAMDASGVGSCTSSGGS